MLFGITQHYDIEDKVLTSNYMIPVISPIHHMHFCFQISQSARKPLKAYIIIYICLEPPESEK